MKRIFSLLFSARLQTHPAAWGIILLVVLAYFIPYAFPGNTYVTLQAYNAFALLPPVIGALLREYRGALIACALILFGLIVLNIRTQGFTWSSSLLTTLFIGNGIGLFLGLSASQFSRMSRQLLQAHSNLELAHSAIQTQALTDIVTGLPNHRAISQSLEQELERARRFGRPLSLIFFDGDRFKRVNDTYGHVVGDVVLRQLGERTSGVLRAGDTVGRFGGEEFVVLLPETSSAEACLIAERIRSAVTTLPLATSEVEGGIHTTISLGLAAYPTDAHSVNALLEKGDQAMYCAKKLGRNQVRTVAEAEQMGRNSAFTAFLQQDAELRDEVGDAGDLLLREQRIHQLGPIYSLMRLVELRDTGMNAHSHAVSDLASMIAQEMDLDQEQVLTAATAALLHDVGKVAIPDSLLKKEGHLSPTEHTLIQQHPDFGAQIVESSPFLMDLAPAIRHHHEHWDGQGYPYHLRGDEIPLMARIIAVAEAYDAIITNRLYQAARPPAEALAELQRCAGTQFDTAVVHAAITVLVRQTAPEEIHLVQAS